MTKTTLETCDIWDTDYTFDNWEPEFMTICATWQLRVTLDSIRNSWDVLVEQQGLFHRKSHAVGSNTNKFVDDYFQLFQSKADKKMEDFISIAL